MYLYTYIYIYILTYTYISIYLHIHTYTYLCIFKYVYIKFILIHVWNLCVCLLIYTHMFIHMHMYIHVYLYTHFLGTHNIIHVNHAWTYESKTLNGRSHGPRRKVSRKTTSWRWCRPRKSLETWSAVTTKVMGYPRSWVVYALETPMKMDDDWE